VAEQNSVDVAWALLMDDSFSAIRVIYSNDDELKRFRQLVVNSVMATDIMDKDLKELRNSLGSRFQEVPLLSLRYSRHCESGHTIVIEHLIKLPMSHDAALAHLPYGTSVYLKIVRGLQVRHSDKDPSDFWYKGEMGFFDFYIIPLAKSSRIAVCLEFPATST
jgi:hypothetical protein